MTLVRNLLIMVLCSLLAACAPQGMDDLERFVEEVKSRQPKPIDPIPQMKPVETFVYLAGERRDPFRPLQQTEEQEIAQAQNNGVHPDFSRQKEELEQYPLDALRMMGTLQQSGTIWGLIANQEGALYRVKTGNYMGKNHGQITRISEDRIELTEIAPDSRGGYEERHAILAISDMSPSKK